MTPEIETKHCRRCSKDKPKSCFGRCRSRRDGLQAYCMDCLKAYQAGRKEQNAAAAARYRQSAKGQRSYLRRQLVKKQAHLDAHSE